MAKMSAGEWTFPIVKGVCAIDLGHGQSKSTGLAFREGITETLTFGGAIKRVSCYARKYNSAAVAVIIEAVPCGLYDERGNPMARGALEISRVVNEKSTHRMWHCQPAAVTFVAARRFMHCLADELKNDPVDIHI